MNEAVSKKIVLTGGGTAGHVTPNIALLPRLRELGYSVSYIGSYEGIEKKLITELSIPYYGIATGKFRRYLDIKNFTDPFRVIKGFYEARRHLKDIRPDLVFSKGGFVSVPVIRAAASLHIPCMIHESDMTPGLANRLCIPVAEKVCCNFPETVAKIPGNKALLTGSPIREELFRGEAEEGRRICGFQSDKPVILVTGGSLGAMSINSALREALPKLLEHYRIIHICGKGKLDESLLHKEGYVQFEYVEEELKHFLALSSLVISRAGANTICELLALKKPNLLIPLPLNSSRGDQILNAGSFAAQGFSRVLPDEELSPERLAEAVDELFRNRQDYVDAMNRSSQLNAVKVITDTMESIVG